jgi:hypothetical protein
MGSHPEHAHGGGPHGVEARRWAGPSAGVDGVETGDGPQPCGRPTSEVPMSESPR